MLKPVSILCVCVCVWVCRCVCVCVCVCVCRSLRCPLSGISACFPKGDVFGGGSRWVWSTSNFGLTLLEPTGWGKLKLEWPKCKFCMNVMNIAISLARYLAICCT